MAVAAVARRALVTLLMLSVGSALAAGPPSQSDIARMFAEGNYDGADAALNRIVAIRRDAPIAAQYDFYEINLMAAQTKLRMAKVKPAVAARFAATAAAEPLARNDVDTIKAAANQTRPQQILNRRGQAVAIQVRVGLDPDQRKSLGGIVAQCKAIHDVLKRIDRGFSPPVKVSPVYVDTDQLRRYAENILQRN